MQFKCEALKPNLFCSISFKITTQFNMIAKNKASHHYLFKHCKTKVYIVNKTVEQKVKP